MTPTEEAGISGKIAAVIFLILLGLTAVLMLFSFPAGIYTVFFTHLSNSTYSTLGSPYLWVGPIPLLIPVTISYGAAFLGATLIYIAMFAFALLQGKGFFSTLRDTVRGGASKVFANGGIVTIVSIGFLLFTAALVDIAVSAAGSTTGDPFKGLDALAVLLGFTLAPLREEFGFRVLIIGVVAFVLCFWRSKGQALRALWRPSVAYQGAARDSAVLIGIWVAGAASSGIFGLCHVACGGTGWDIGKLPEATYGGVVLAYLYIRYGFHVAVLGHWGVDYFGSVFAFFGQGAYGISWTATPEYWLQALVDVDVLLLFGVACFLLVSYVGLRRLLTRKAAQPEVQTPVGSSYPPVALASRRES